jgi:DNA-binding NtrC family response regulator
MTRNILARLMFALRPNLPIILCTGYRRDISNNKSFTLGVRNFLVIPLVVQSLTALIRKILDHEKNKSALTKVDDML